MRLRSDSVETTHAIAGALASLARVGDVIVLAGEMGAGKTAFAQGFGRALGVAEPLTSPTFTLVHTHPCAGRRLTLHHADLYRLESTGEIDELALAELAESDGIVLVEWGDVAAAALGEHLEVRLEWEREELDGEHDDGEHDDEETADHVDEEDAGDRDDLGDGAVGAGIDEDFGLHDGRLIELSATGASWAGRWERLATALEPYRC